MNELNENHFFSVKRVKDFFFGDRFRIFCMICVLLVALKFFLFYKLIGVNTGFVLVWILSCLFTGLFFAIFKNKWIPAVLFFIFSFLMFSDVTYYSFFQRYLSVNMLGAVEVVGDIGESIKEVLRPVNFLMIFDALSIIITLIVNKICKSKNIKDNFINSENMDVCNNELNNTTSNINYNIESFKINIETYSQEQIEENLERNFDINSYNNSEHNADSVFDKILKKKHLSSALALVLCLVIIIAGSTQSTLLTSIKNQEILAFHISDVFAMQGESGEDALATFKDTYPIEKKGELFGIAKDRNVVFIQIESFMNFVIGRYYNGQEITPNLNKLIKDNSIYFDNFYMQVGSGNTSDAEFAANNSIYGTVLSYTYKVYGETNYFRGLPVLLKEKGYDTAVFHAFEDRTFWNRDNAYDNLGFDRYFGGLVQYGGDYTMTEWMGWGLTDSEFFKQTVPLIQENLKEPYYAFVNTLSNHHPFKMLDHYQLIELGEDEKDTLVGSYLQSIAYTDYSIGLFLDALKEQGMYENSIFIMYGDHAGLTFSDETNEVMTRILGKSYDYDELLNIPMIIHIPNPEKNVTNTVSVTGGHLDILPTVAYLLGFKELDTIYFGHNLLTIDSGFAAEQTFIKRGSFVKDDIIYEMSLDGVFENGRAWNKKTGKSVSLDGLKNDYLKSMDIILASEYVLKNDVLRTIYLDGGGLSDIADKNIRKEYPDELVLCGYPDLNLIGENSIEALDKSYDCGYRYIRLTLNWTDDGEHAYTLKNQNSYGIPWTLGDYPPQGSIDEKNNYKNAIMNEKDIINWMSEHPDAYLVVDIDGELIYTLDNTLTFFGERGEAGTSAGRRMILVAERTNDFTGRHDIFIDMSACDSDNETLKSFIDINDVWAIIIKEHDAKDSRKELLDANCMVYIAYDTGVIKKLKKEGEQN